VAQLEAPCCPSSPSNYSFGKTAIHTGNMERFCYRFLFFLQGIAYPITSDICIEFIGFSVGRIETTPICPVAKALAPCPEKEGTTIIIIPTEKAPWTVVFFKAEISGC
jgi:hypothetical protein